MYSAKYKSNIQIIKYSSIKPKGIFTTNATILNSDKLDQKRICLEDFERMEKSINIFNSLIEAI